MALARLLRTLGISNSSANFLIRFTTSTKSDLAASGPSVSCVTVARLNTARAKSYFVPGVPNSSANFRMRITTSIKVGLAASGPFVSRVTVAS